MAQPGGVNDAEILSGFKSLHEAVALGFATFGERLDKMDERIGRLEQSMLRRFDAMDRRFDAMDVRFDALEARVARLEPKRRPPRS